MPIQRTVEEGKRNRQNRAGKSHLPQQVDIFGDQFALRSQDNLRLVEEEPELHHVSEDAIGRSTQTAGVGETAKYHRGDGAVDRTDRAQFPE